MDKSVTQTRIQMRLKEAEMNIYSCYNNVMPPPPPPPKSDIISCNYFIQCLVKNKNIFLFLFAALLMLQTHAQTEPPPKPFITTWETSSDGESITIPTVSEETYSYTVNWGDNTTDNMAYTGDAAHTYSKAGTYTVSISGTFPRIRFGSIDDIGRTTGTTAAGQVRTVEQWGDIAWTSMRLAFVRCSNLTVKATDAPDFSGVTDMSSMFNTAFLIGDLSKWDVSNVTNMESMFTTLQSDFDGGISDWNVSNVTNMQFMFLGTNFNGDLSEWDISSVMNMQFMFSSGSTPIVDMSSENYDKLLIGWGTLDTQAGETRIPSNITLDAPNFYSCRGRSRRDTLIMRYSWTIRRDELVPILTDKAELPAITAQCEVTAADLTAPTANNKCDGTGTKVTATHSIPDDAFPITSDTVITWTYTDNSKSIVQTQQVTITGDTTDPVPMEADLPILEDCSQVTSLTAPTATDNCDGTIMGTTNVTPPITTNMTIMWTYTDAAGNTSTQTQQVTIDDTTDPVPMEADLPMLEDCSQITSLTAPTATDNCDGTITAATATTPPITASTTITWTYTDAGNNTATQTQEVVIDDNTPPSVAGTLSEVMKQCEVAMVTDLTAPTTTDNCDSGAITATTDAAFPITSTTTITWTYTDAAGNTSTQTQQVTIMDTTDPIPMEADLPALEGCSQVTSLTAPIASDNCDGTIMGTTSTTPPITASTTLTWTYTDAAGNAVTQMQEVVVNSDVLIPDVPSLPILTEQCRIAALSSPTAKNCSGNTITATTTATLPITTNSTIMWTYTDGGNTATQTQEVMIRDTMNPVPDNTLSALSAAGSLAQADVTVPTATDNCDGQIMAVPDVTFPITSDVTITWTYTDAAGNTATQTQQVTITAAPLSATDDAAEAVIFPNPSGDYLEVRSAIGGTFQLLSLSGKPLLEGTTNIRVDITSLQSGLYLVQLPDGRLLKFVRE